MVGWYWFHGWGGVGDAGMDWTSEDGITVAAVVKLLETVVMLVAVGAELDIVQSRKWRNPSEPPVKVIGEDTSDLMENPDSTTAEEASKML